MFPITKRVSVFVVIALSVLSSVTCASDTSSDEPVAGKIANTGQFECPEQFGYFDDPADCSKYFVCVFGEALHEQCTGGLYFSVDHQTCDWPRNIGCKRGKWLTVTLVASINYLVTAGSYLLVRFSTLKNDSAKLN